MRRLQGTPTEEQLSSKRLAREGKSQEEEYIGRGYLDRERSKLNDPGKEEQRRRVADFIMSFQTKDNVVRLISLPSIHWTFEHLLVKEYPQKGFFFTGLENNWGVVELSRAFMPGQPTLVTYSRTRIGAIEGFCSSKKQEVKPVNSHLLYTDSSSFFGLSFAETRKESAESTTRSRFDSLYRKTTAFWLDFTSQLCPQIHRSLGNVGNFVSFDKGRAPIVVTFMGARDDFDSDEDRVDAAVKSFSSNPLRNFELLESWRYVNQGIAMLNVAGLLVRKFFLP